MNGVYCLTFPNGKRYVGIAFRRQKRAYGMGIERRWKDYSRYDCKNQPKLYNALKKYGWENVKREVILETEDYERAGKIETQLIALWNLRSDNYGYNICSGGCGGWLGVKHKKSSIKKMSKALTLRNSNPEYRRLMAIKKTGQGLKTRIVIDTITGKEYEVKNAPEFCKEHNIPHGNFICGLNSIGKYKNFLLKGFDGNFKRITPRTIKNKITGEEVTGIIHQLAKIHGFEQTNMCKHGISKGWILLDHPRWKNGN